MKKQNCWEFRKCGREKSNGKEACPAATQIRANGINGGTNGGRICWVIGGTLCDKKIQGAYAQKILSCSECGFRDKVKAEESYHFIPIFF